MKSLIQSLAQVGKGIPFSIRKGFQTYPNSIKEIIRILNLPNPEIGKLQYRRIYDFTEEESQGLTYAYVNVWYLSSAERIFRCSIEGTDLYNPTKITRLESVTLSDLIGTTDLNKNYANHIGDIAYSNGLIFTAINYKQGEQTRVILLAISENLKKVIGYAWLSEDTGNMGCAINPWNNLLYIPCDTGEWHTGCLHAYDVSEFYKILPQLNKWGKLVNISLLKDKCFWFYKEDKSLDVVRGIQGIAFSQNGRLYVTKCNGSGPWDNYIRIYNALTGTLLGEKEYDFPGDADEIEGISIHPSGIIYIAVNDNDWLLPWDKDEFEIHAFKYSDPSILT